MAISKKTKILRDIAMMVRKDCITLQPHDRILLDIGSGKGKLYVGQVFYDFDSGNHCYRLYNEEGLLIIPKDGPRVLPGVLSVGEMDRLAAVLPKYVENSVNRAMNISEIDDILAGVKEDTFYFTDGKKMPEVMVDYSFDGRLQGPFTIEGMYRDPVNQDTIWLRTQGPDHGDVTSFRLADISDMGVSMVHEAVVGQVRGEFIKQDRSARVSEKKGVSIS